MIRVLRIIARLNVGGPAKHVIWLTSRLSDKFERTLVSGRVESNEDELTAFCRAEKVSPVYVDGLGRSIGPRDLPALWNVLKIMAKIRPDIVHTHTAKAGMLGRTAAFLLNLLPGKRIRTVHTFHGHVLHGYFSAPVTMLFRMIEKILGHIASDRIVVISEQQLEELAGRYRVAPRSKFVLIRLGLDLEPFLRAPRPGHEGYRIGFVGRLTAIKDPMMFLEAGRRVIAAEPRARLVIVGDGEMRSAMEAAAPPGTEFLGNRDDMPEVMAGLDAFVISSLNEGTPLSVIEAFAAGVPVAATNVGGCVDLLADGRGLLCDKQDPAALSANILRLLREPALTESIRARAREYVQREYSLPRLVRDVEALYEGMIRKA